MHRFYCKPVHFNYFLSKFQDKIRLKNHKMIVIKEMKDTNEVRLQFVNIGFKYGLATSNPNNKSVIFKPYDRIIERGKETGYISYLFLNTHTESSTFSENEVNNVDNILHSEEFLSKISAEYIKTLGCICYTKGKQILFYPAYTSNFFKVFTDRDKPLKHEKNILIDHYTLEPSFENWHITYSKGHYRSKLLKTRRIDDNLINWFGISINSNVKFEQVFQNNAFAYTVQVSDAERRIQDIAASLEYKKEYLITAPIIDDSSNKDSFYHFEFYVQVDSSILSKKPGIIALPNQENLQIPISGKMMYTDYEIDIPNCKGKLIIVATKVAGILKDEALIRFS